jgi:hypothetical protein
MELDWNRIVDVGIWIILLNTWVIVYELRGIRKAIYRFGSRD